MGDQRPGLLGQVLQLLRGRAAPRADGRRALPPRRRAGGALCDENTIGVVAILGSTFDGSYEPVAEIAAALDDLQARTGSTSRCTSTGRPAAMVAPFLDPDLEWDFRLPRVASINTSGHKYGLVYPGVGWVVWRDTDALPEELVFKVNYLGGEMPTFALNFSRPGGQVVAQYYTFLRLGREGFRQVQQDCRDVATYLSGADREDRAVPPDHPGDELPVFAFTLPRRRHELQRLRRLRGDCASAAGWCRPTPSRPTARTWRCCASWCATASGREMADLLLDDLAHLLPRLQRQAQPARGTETSGFDHATAQRKT